MIGKAMFVRYQSRSTPEVSMTTLRKRWLVFLISGLILGAAAWYKWPTTASAAEASLTAPVKQGEFKVLVTTTGELRANKFVQVTGPASAQQVNVYQTKIASIVPEGTRVNAGDVIAELDRQPAATRAADVALSLTKAQAEYTAAMLDSTLNLANSREDVRTAEYTLEEKKIAKEQAQFEAPSIKRQAEIDYEKAQRAWDQSKRNLDTKTKQAVAKMASVGADLHKQENMLKNIQEVMGSFTIKAPTPGMVIYIREWNGKKKGVGSQWNAWDNTVATLPDLAHMESQTYINEVDVRKIAVGQKVEITLDADASKKLQGTVTQIANVGEQRPNQDSKVFEVKVAITQSDTTLRPGMTTANAIEVASIPNVLSIPLESTITEGGYTYVYQKTGRGVVKQMIETGTSNDNEIIVRKGLTKDDRVLLAPPTDKSDIKTEIVPGLKPMSDTTKRSDAASGVTLPLPKKDLTPPKKATPAPTLKLTKPKG
jgi:RND family efflux transporter MFP subunit